MERGLGVKDLQLIDSTTAELAEFLTAARRTAQELNTILGEDNLREDLWRILMCLSRAGGMSMGEISESQVIPHATTTRLIDEMTDNGLVFRRPSPDDRRKTIVHLSQRGKERLLRANALLSARVGKFPEALVSSRA